MKKQIISIMTAGIICMISAMPCNVLAVEDENLSVYAREIWEIVNEERTKEGLAPLEFSPELNEVANVRAGELLEICSHTRPDGTSYSTALDEKNITSSPKGENITMFMNKGDDIAGIAMNNWMNSEGHRKNILNENYSGIGVGVAYQDGGYYLVQIFGGDFVQWDLSGGTLIIKGGSGIMPTGTRADRPWHSETENVTEVILADNITKISEWAFAHCSNLPEITIPANVAEVENYAFYECNSLEEITFLNPECIIGENTLTIPDNTVICGYDGSSAQKYAETNGYTFKNLGEVPYEPAKIQGDANYDGKFNIADLVMVRNWLFGSDDLKNWKNVDLNHDNIIDIFDFTIMKNMLVNQ